MAERIVFSTVWPERMGDLAGQPTRFPEKILAGIMMEDGYVKHGIGDCVRVMEPAGYKCDLGIIDNRTHTHLPNGKIVPFTGGELKPNYIPKTTTIRSNYDYWKSKEGQLIQPFFWAGKPRKSKQVVFCPQMRLKKVRFIRILHMEGRNVYIGEKEGDEMPFYIDDEITGGSYGDDDMQRFAHDEGFNSVDDFFKWFNKDFDGALLEFKRVEG